MFPVTDYAVSRVASAEQTASTPASPPRTAPLAPPRVMEATHRTYIPGLDGLRALAVSAVLLYHADLPWATGGFLGVDLFFVLSGYLITTLLDAEWVQQERINIVAFWYRRARRLLPALFVVLAVVLVYAVLFLPREVAGLRAGVVAALLYAMNWYLIYGQQSYFAAVGRPSPLQHLWSLAVEEQFYLCWPFVFVVAMRVLGRRGVLLLTLSGAAVSTAMMAARYSPITDPSRLYYGTDTHATALLVGAALALLVRGTRHGAAFSACRCIPNRSIGSRRVGSLDVAGVGALAGLAVCVAKLDAYAPLLYRGGFALVALAAGVVIAAVVHPQAWLLPGMLGIRGLRWIGMRSYGIYLWHWPVFTVTRPHLDVPLDGAPLLGVRLALTVGLAALSYHFVEAPVRRGALRQIGQRIRVMRANYRNHVWQIAALGGITGCGVWLLVAVGTAQPAPPPAYLAVSAVHSTSPARASAVRAAIVAQGPTPETIPTPAPTPVVTVAFAPATRPLPVVVSSPSPSLPAPSPSLPAPSTLPIPAAPTPPGNGPTPPAQTRAVPEIVTFARAIGSVGTMADSPTVPPPAASAPTPPPPDPIPPDDAMPAAAPSPVMHVFAIGDSVMVGAAPALQERFADIEIDAAVSRQASVALDLLRARHDDGQLGDAVVIHMGTNGTFAAAEFDAIMRTLTDVPHVVFVNLKVPRPWEAADNAVIAAGVRRYPGVALVDWHAAGTNHPEYFWDDGIHLRPAGAQAYAEMIAAALGA